MNGRKWFLTPFLLLAAGSAAHADFDSGVAASKNFTVLAPRGDHLAKKVLHHAEMLRDEVARRWFGQPLPEGDARTHILVTLSDDVDEGLTLLAGPGYSASGDHRIWLTTTRERALGTTLAHEITHVVLAGGFAAPVPAWANEGIASRRDDAGRAAIRRRWLEHFARTGNWPRLPPLLAARSIHPTDQQSYTVAVSLTEYLLAHGGPRKFVRFLAAGSDWDDALSSFYGINGTATLQRRWQSWASTTSRRSLK